jgi:hypothetical protein
MKGVFMDRVSLAQLIPVLQTSIAPMILISGIGLLLLTMTNRLGRVIDRARVLAAALPEPGDSKRAKTAAQLQILWTRARLIRFSIALSSTSALAAAILIIVLFVSALLRIETEGLIGGLFIVCMVSLIVSLIAFIKDINESLSALKLELAE